MRGLILDGRRDGAEVDQGLVLDLPYSVHQYSGQVVIPVSPHFLGLRSLKIQLRQIRPVH